MIKCFVFFIFITISKALFCQIEYSLIRFFDKVEVNLNYNTDYEKALARNKVKTMTSIYLVDDSLMPQVPTYKCEFDKKGREISFHAISHNYYDVTIYNNTGQVATEIRFDTLKNDTLFIVHYEYNTCKYLSGITFWAEKNGLHTWKYTNHYDSACRLVMQDIIYNNKPYGSNKYEYDSAGNIKVIERYNGQSDKAYEKNEYTYDSLGRIVIEKKDTFEKKISYNKSGQVENIELKRSYPSETYIYYPNGLKKERISEGTAEGTMKSVYSYEFYK